jgi:hypothetical protein
MDPYAVLGVDPGASPQELAAAYRRLAKRWHPDRGRSPDAQRRMAEVNAAYDLARTGLAADGPRPAAGDRPAVRRPARRRGGWLPEGVRSTLGRELLEALHDGEDVRVVTSASTWASPRTRLALTDRRLLWLLDDAPVARVRALRLHDVAEADVRLGWPRRRTATLRVRARNGRRVAFADLPPDTARAVLGGLPAPASAR